MIVSKRRPSLSEYEMTSTDDYEIMQSGSRVFAPKIKREERIPTKYFPTSTVEGGCCWCGLPYNHEWEGMKDGAPHPSKRHEIVGVSPKLTPMQHVIMKALSVRMRPLERLHNTSIAGLVSRGLVSTFGSYAVLTEKGRLYVSVGKKPL